MASYFLALTILVVISVAYGHGGSEGRGGSESRGGSEGRGVSGGRGESEGNRGGWEHNPILDAFEEFIRNLTATQRDAFFNITLNSTLTKAERQTQVGDWAASLVGEPKALYQNLFTTYQEAKTNYTQKLEAEIANLNETAQAVGKQILALINNQSISEDATFQAIKDLIKAQADDVQKELKPLLPFVDAHENHRLPGGHGSERGNFARGSERGNSANGGEHGNSDYGRRVKRLIK